MEQDARIVMGTGQLSTNPRLGEMTKESGITHALGAACASYRWKHLCRLSPSLESHREENPSQLLPDCGIKLLKAHHFVTSSSIFPRVGFFHFFWFFSSIFLHHRKIFKEETSAGGEQMGKKYPSRFNLILDSNTSERLYRLARKNGRTSGRQIEFYLKTVVDSEWEIHQQIEDEQILEKRWMETSAEENL